MPRRGEKLNFTRIRVKKKLTKKYAFEKNKFPAKTKFSGEGNCGNIKKTSLLEGEKFHFDNVEKNI